MVSVFFEMPSKSSVRREPLHESFKIRSIEKRTDRLLDRTMIMSLTRVSMKKDYGILDRTMIMSLTRVSMKKDYVLRKQQREIRQLFNRMRGGKFETFEEMIDQFRSTLRHDDVIITDDLAGNLQWYVYTVRRCYLEGVDPNLPPLLVYGCRGEIC